jgi:bacteriocin-like protein
MNEFNAVSMDELAEIEGGSVKSWIKAHAVQIAELAVAIVKLVK